MVPGGDGVGRGRLVSGLGLVMIRKLDNPPNPFCSRHVEYLADVPEAKIEVYEEQARSILSHNDSPDLPFDWSVEN